MQTEDESRERLNLVLDSWQSQLRLFFLNSLRLSEREATGREGRLSRVSMVISFGKLNSGRDVERMATCCDSRLDAKLATDIPARKH
jgi:hypothetical protein